MTNSPTDKDCLGFGLGLRPDHYERVLDEQPEVDWLEIISENYMVDGGKALHYLDRIRALYPMVMHGVSMSIGSTAPLNIEYLERLKQLIDRVEPEWVSDHLCWTGVDGLNLHDLMPLPYTEETIEHLVTRVSQVQDFLGRQILLENVSSYVTYQASEMSEWVFLSTLAKRAGCLILLDINNIYVSSQNHGFDPVEYLDGIPAKHVQQFHLAGHSFQDQLIIDTHDHPISDPVWSLYQKAVERFGPIATMIERDANIPPLEELLAELDLARRLAAEQDAAAA
jgi:uncharacterized protein (UPF0276 family)